MATFSDDFNRADSSNLGAGWVEVSGDWSIASNRLHPGTATGTVIARAATAMDTSDHSAQATIAVAAVASQGVWCRGDASLTTGYLWRNDGSTWNLFAVSGGFTSIGSFAGGAVSGDVMKVQAVGSTIKGFVNGVERVSVTNTTVTSGTSCGLRSDTPGTLRYDDFTAADFVSGVTLGTATETDTAQPLTGGKATTLGTAITTEQAQPWTGAKAASVGAATSTEAARPLTGAKTATLGTASSTETAQPITGTVSATLGTATVAEVAQPITGSKSATLGTALEVDTARPITPPAGAIQPHPDRTYAIPAENRTLIIPADPRTVTVGR
ncbi:hypothetical protein AB0M28_13515 [Streptomyces sp. NPDC051940]|uniref:hypothetical protein n=1 Tax=Streptomyces sp. NPDC051940 TaxID=3155675 RepID=UPI003435710C